jgi:hypothetical protein
MTRFVEPKVHAHCARCASGEWAEHHDPPRRVFTVWGDGHEFGKDYPTVVHAWLALLRYRKDWPGIRYYVRDERGRFAG